MTVATPTVSVCIPAFERPALTVRALESVLAQTYDDYEIVVTDDSRDDTVAEALAPYQGRERLRYHKNSRRLGASSNWNAALRLARGRYVKFLHHDDWLAGPDSLARFVRLLDEDRAADLGFCASSQRNAAGQEISVHRLAAAKVDELRRDHLLLYPHNLVGTPSATIFRNRPGLAFDEKLTWVVDLEFYLAILRKNGRFVYCPDALVCVSDGLPGQLTQACAGVPEIELFEWTYLYQKLGSPLGKRYLRFLYDLFARFDPSALPALYRRATRTSLRPTVQLLVQTRRILNLVRAVRP